MSLNLISTNLSPEMLLWTGAEEHFFVVFQDFFVVVLKITRGTIDGC